MLRFIDVARVSCALLVVLGSGSRVAAQGFDVTFFVGRAFPVDDERLTLRPPNPTVPGVDVTVVGSPRIDVDGGPVFGGAIAFEFGILGIEGRLDVTKVELALTGARYDFRDPPPPTDGLSASVTVFDGTFDTDRIGLLSVNARVRTPGPIALVVSGGLSYLPDFSVAGSVPLRLEVPGIPVPPGVEPTLTLRAAPGQSDDRWGVNGGAGLRIGRRIAFMGEIRFFYFQDYEFRFDVEDGPELLDDLLAGLPPVRFDPIFVNAQAGVTFRF